MKPDITKHLSRFDFAMIGNLFPLTEDMVYDIMLDKGDIDGVSIIKDVSSMCDEMPKGKSMKAAERRKKTFHKRKQREKLYRDLGYPIERFSASERGKMREGVGMFPETQHMNSMYNRNSCEGGMRGNRKVNLSVVDALSEMQHDLYLDWKEQELASLDEVISGVTVDILCVDEMLKDIDDELEYYESQMSDLLVRIEALTTKAEKLEQKREEDVDTIQEFKRLRDSFIKKHK